MNVDSEDEPLSDDPQQRRLQTRRRAAKKANIEAAAGTQNNNESDEQIQLKAELGKLTRAQRSQLNNFMVVKKEIKIKLEELRGGEKALSRMTIAKLDDFAARHCRAAIGKLAAAAKKQEKAEVLRKVIKLRKKELKDEYAGLVTQFSELGISVNLLNKGETILDKKDGGDDIKDPAYDPKMELRFSETELESDIDVEDDKKREEKKNDDAGAPTILDDGLKLEMKRFMVDAWREIAAKAMANGQVPSQVGKGAVPYPGTVGDEKNNTAPAPGANLPNDDNVNEIKKKKEVLKKIKEVISKNKVPRARKVYAQFFVFVFLSLFYFYFSYFSYFFRFLYFIFLYFIFYF